MHWHAIGTQAQGCSLCQKRTICHKAIQIGKAQRRFLFLGKRRGEVQEDSGKLSFSKKVRKIAIFLIEYENRIGNPLGNSALGTTNHAYTVHVDADKQRIGPRGGALYGVLPLSAAQIEHNML